MKKILFSIFSAAILFTGCDPLEDTYNELDLAGNTASYSLNVSLTSKEYGLLKNVSGAEDVVKNNNFSSEESAKTLIPVILDKMYPQMGKGSSAMVTYDVYNAVRINNATEFTMTAEDYAGMGLKFPNLSSDSQIISAAKYLVPDASEKDVVTLTYDFFSSGSVSSKTSKLVYLDGSWNISFVPTADDYKELGQSYANFDNKTTAKTNLAIYFNRIYPYNKAGDIRTAIYTYTYVPTGGSRVYVDNLAVFTFDGTAWAAVQDVNKQKLQFGHDGENWVPDNTVKYTLVSADYTEIGKLATDAAAKESVGRYGNFDLKLWSDADLVTYLGARLKVLFPNAAVGQKYLVTYKTFNPSGTASKHLILNSSGSYELVK